MKTTATIVDEQGRLIVSGELNFETIIALWKQSLPLLANYPRVDVDLSNVTASNSGGLALLLEWLKYGKRKNKVIHFSGMSAQLKSIAQVAGIGSLFADE